MEDSKKQQVIGLERLYNDAEWAPFIGKPVIPIGAETGTNNLVANLQNGGNFLVGGKTGSGKSSFFHAAIVNVLCNTNPDELKFILIDPKGVELGVYKHIPQLLFPVITNVQDARKALEWCMSEIDRRSDLFAKQPYITIEDYNAKSPHLLPRIVIVIDECSDLLVSDHEFFEGAIRHITSGIQLKGLTVLLGTSRPSPQDVYTKELTDMFDYRIAFATATAEDSVSILGVAGAEKLRGSGDMLFLYPDIEVPTHIQGFFVSHEEMKEAIAKATENVTSSLD